MIRVSQAVDQIITNDRVAIEAVQRDIFNASSYARQILPQIEEMTMKEVSFGTVVVSLNRIIARVKEYPALTPKVRFTSLNIVDNIVEVTYEKTEEVLKNITILQQRSSKSVDYFTLTQGLHEITILCSREGVEELISNFGTKPKVVISDLVAISVRFPESYVPVANTIYSLVSILATKHSNIMEIVSTYTELTFIVYKKDMEEIIKLLNNHQQSE